MFMRVCSCSLSLLPCFQASRSFEERVNEKKKKSETKRKQKKKKKKKKKKKTRWPLRSLAHKKKEPLSSETKEKNKALSLSPLSPRDNHDAGLGPRRPRQGKREAGEGGERSLCHLGHPPIVPGPPSSVLFAALGSSSSRLCSFSSPFFSCSSFFLLLPVFLKTGPWRFGRARWAYHRHALRLRHCRGGKGVAEGTAQGASEKSEDEKRGMATSRRRALFSMAFDSSQSNHPLVPLPPPKSNATGAHVQDGADRVPQRPIHGDGGEARGELRAGRERKERLGIKTNLFDSSGRPCSSSNQPSFFSSSAPSFALESHVPLLLVHTTTPPQTDRSQAPQPSADAGRKGE